ncbi:MOXD1-like protein 2 [Aphelenchoides fujianensis]|nr:MOXD1-like protein 2 [Aphelenchoides fujianensis]
MILRWRTPVLLLASFLLAHVLDVVLSADPSPKLWLLQPQSRLMERDPKTTRLAEAKCPTMKRPNDPTTTLTAGGVIEVVWANPSNISGPSKFDVLSGDEILGKLEPADGEETDGSKDEGKSSISLKLPNFECKACVLRLTQSTPDGEMQFVSCADIQLAHLAEGSNGTVVGLHRLLGECGLRRKTASARTARVFAKAGRFGRKCDKTSIFKSLAAASNYATIPLENKANSLKWRYDNKKEELEFVVELQNGTWAAIGLKNEEAGAKDANSLDLDAENTIAPSLHIQKIVSNYLSTTPLPGSSECGPNEEYSECPEFSRECEPSCDWTAFPETIPVCPKACGPQPRCVCKEGFVREANEKSPCRPFEFCHSVQPEPSKCPANQTWAKCGVACEPTCENMYNTDPCTASCQEQACSCLDNFVRHSDGVCRHWSECPNLEERVLNADGTETTDFGTIPARPSTLKPRVIESKCPTNETFNECGRHCEADCSSIFDREDCQGCSAPGCSCAQGFARMNGTCRYWGDCPKVAEVDAETVQKLTTLAANAVAGGQEETSRSTGRTPKTTAAPVAANSAEMPPADEEMLCFGEFVHPPRCENDDCLYRLSWAFVPEADHVEFSLETRMNRTKGWTGVGFSPSGRMGDADFLIVKTDGKQLSIVDMHADGYSQTWKSGNAVGTHVDGVLKATFLRKRKTEDVDEDASFGDSDADCHYFLFPIDGGDVAKVGKRRGVFNHMVVQDGSIAPHIETPLISSRKICIRACNGQMSTDESSEPPKPKIPKIPTYSCQNEFRFPSNCTDDCDYRARWAFDRREQAVMFEVASKGVGRWTGIGWSRDGEMTNSDVYLGWVYGKKAFVLDRFAYGRQLPAVDPADRQDLYDVHGRVEDDFQTITFKRKLVTADKKTDLPLDRCYFFLFPVGGGRILTRKPSDFENPKTPIGFHDQQTPERSAVPICICTDDNKPVGETPPPPAVLRRRRQADPFDQRVAPGDLSHLLPAVQRSSSAEQKDDPFACTDVALVELSKEGRVRVIDGFAPEAASVQPDESFNGLQSLHDVAVLPPSKGRTGVVLRKSVKTEDLADFKFNDEIGSLVFASGPIGTLLADAPFVKSVALNLLDPRAPVVATKLSETIATSAATTEEPQTTAIPSTTTEREEEVEETTSSSRKSSTSTTSSTTTTTTTDQTTPAVEEEETTPKKPEEETKATAAPPAASSEWITDESDANCAGSFFFPGAECSYVAQWALNEERTDLRVHLEAMLPTAHWTSIGFSSDGGMPNSDAIIVTVKGDSSVNVVDQFNPSYGRPTVDKQQDLREVSTAYVDGRVVANFVRSLSTNDDEDADLLDDCHHVVLVPSGGELSGKDLRKHSETPISSRNRFCPAKCRAAAPATTPKPAVQAEETERPPKKVHVQTAGGAAIPPIGEAPSEDRVTSMLSQEIVDNLRPLVEKRWKGLKAVNVTNFAYSTTESIGVTEPNHGSAPSILALTQFTFDPKDAPNADELRDFLKDAMAQTANGPLNVDPNAVLVKPNERREEDEKWGPLKNAVNWFLIGAVALLLLALILGCLCCGFCSRRKTHPEPLSFGQPMSHPSTYHHFAASSYPTATMTYDTNKGTDVSKATASTDTQNGNGGGTLGRKEVSNVKGTPKGMGEVSYSEWRKQVASKESPSHHEESLYQSPPMRQLTNAPYITDPNGGFYTLGGDHRIAPPNYYRHY